MSGPEESCGGMAAGTPMEARRRDRCGRAGAAGAGAFDCANGSSVCFISPDLDFRMPRGRSEELLVLARLPRDEVVERVVAVPDEFVLLKSSMERALTPITSKGSLLKPKASSPMLFSIFRLNSTTALRR